MKILSIDVGIINFAMVAVELSEDYLEREEVIKYSEIFLCELIDITELMSKCEDLECELYHDKIICDYMMHLFKKFRELFDSVDIILIERQPFTGLVAIQELIMREYRNKSFLISPRAMLNFFGILDFVYEERKVHTENIATEYLNEFKNFVFNERRHDMADSVCILLYYLSIERKSHFEMVEKDKNKLKFKQVYLDIQKFRYIENE